MYKIYRAKTLEELIVNINANSYEVVSVILHDNKYYEAVIKVNEVKYNG